MASFMDKLGQKIAESYTDNLTKSEYEDIVEYNKMREVYNNLVEIYGERIGEIRFRMYCIKKDIDFHGYGDYRSLEIILGSYNPDKISVECFCHHEDSNRFPENPKEDIKIIMEGYQLLMRKRYGG